MTQIINNAAIEIANSVNAETANLKDWRLNKAGRAMRNVAREALETPLIGTAAEMALRFGKDWSRVADHAADELFVWAINTSVGAGRKHLDIIAIDTYYTDK